MDVATSPTTKEDHKKGESNKDGPPGTYIDESGNVFQWIPSHGYKLMNQNHRFNRYNQFGGYSLPGIYGHGGGGGHGFPNLVAVAVATVSLDSMGEVGSMVYLDTMAEVVSQTPLVVTSSALTTPSAFLYCIRYRAPGVSLANILAEMVAKGK